jgi:hypothetical protein
MLAFPENGQPFQKKYFILTLDFPCIRHLQGLADTLLMYLLIIPFGKWARSYFPVHTPLMALRCYDVLAVYVRETFN